MLWPRLRAPVLALALTALPGTVLLGACRDPKQDAAARSLAQVGPHLRTARAGVERYTRNLVPVLQALSAEIAVPLLENNVDRLRFRLISLATQSTPLGRLDEFKPNFTVAVGNDGVAVARDVAEPDDMMRGMPLARMFPVVAAAVAGTPGLGVGELPATADQPSRVLLFGAVPSRAADGRPAGALVTAISFGRLARALEIAVRVQATAEPVIWVGLRRGGRVLPSGSDKDVPPRWLVPQSLITAIPRDADARLQAAPSHEVTWTFIENGNFGWAGGVTPAPPLDQTTILIYRGEARQR